MYKENITSRCQNNMLSQEKTKRNLNATEV